MKINVLKNETYVDTSTLPKTATAKSTGYDLIITSDPIIVGTKYKNGESTELYYTKIDYIEYKTNLKIQIVGDTLPVAGHGFTEIAYDALVFPRSSISKYNLVLANCVGLIDYDYRGEILLRFKYIWQPDDFKINDSAIIGSPNMDKIYKKGDKACQLKFTKVESAEFFLVDELDKTVRAEGGFGSTDLTSTPIVSDETLTDMIKNYKKVPVYTPEKKYSDIMKERMI
jgi:dUTPase